jgi:hypothetical protein
LGAEIAELNAIVRERIWTLKLCSIPPMGLARRRRENILEDSD